MAIWLVESYQCLPTNRVGTFEEVNGQMVNTEWRSDGEGINQDEEPVIVSAWYDLPASAFINQATGEAWEDLGNVDWRVSYYTIQ